MTIENKLRRDASRYRQQQPPADLPGQLRQALASASRPLPARRWYVPSVAMLAASMVLVLLAGAAWGGVGLGGLESAVRAPGFYDDEGNYDSCPVHTVPETVNGGDEQQRQYADDPAAGTLAATPWIPAAAAGLFTLLAAATGGLLCVGLWGRRLLLPLLLTLTGLTTLGLLVLLG